MENSRESSLNDDSDDLTGSTARIRFKTGSHITYESRNSRSRASSSYNEENGEAEDDGEYSEHPSEDTSVLLDPTICHHHECSLAFNLTKNIRRSSLLGECLPTMIYNKLANLWNLDALPVRKGSVNKCILQPHELEAEDRKVDEFIRIVERDLGIFSNLTDDMQINFESTRGSAKENRFREDRRESLYFDFLRKTGGVGEKPLSSLGKRAERITKVVLILDFTWYRTLGENEGDTLIEESTLQELFQIGFDMPAAKALVVKIRELPTVPECLALLRKEPKHAMRYGLRKILRRDIKMENKPTKMFAFGTMLPKEQPSLRYKPPRNFVKKTWMECSRVPEDLDTMKTVWGGLERLRSTIAFSNWLKNHPEITPPTYLQEKGLLEINYEKWDQMFKGFEMHADNVESTGSYSKIFPQKSSIQELNYDDSNSVKILSMESF